MKDGWVKVLGFLARYVIAPLVVGIVLFFAGIYKERWKEDERRQATITVECDAPDIWSKGCNSCHGDTPIGGKVTDWENRFNFKIKSPQPISLTSASFYLFRVKMMPRSNYALNPTENIRGMQYRPTRPAMVAKAEVCCATPRFIPEIKQHIVKLVDLTDKRTSFPDIQLGKVRVVNEETVSLDFVLDEGYQKEVERLRQSVVQVLGMVVFHTDDKADIPSEPFLITVRTNPDIPERPRPVQMPQVPPPPMIFPTAPVNPPGPT